MRIKLVGMSNSSSNFSHNLVIMLTSAPRRWITLEPRVIPDSNHQFARLQILVPVIIWHFLYYITVN